MFNPSSQGLDLRGAAYVPALGISAHNVMVASPSARDLEHRRADRFRGDLRPRRGTTPWLGKFGLTLTGIVFLVGSALIFSRVFGRSSSSPRCRSGRRGCRGRGPDRRRVRDRENVPPEYRPPGAQPVAGRRGGLCRVEPVLRPARELAGVAFGLVLIGAMLLLSGAGRGARAGVPAPARPGRRRAADLRLGRVSLAVRSDARAPST